MLHEYFSQLSVCCLGDKPYYYNAKTREAAWKKPEGEDITVIKQEEFEAIVASGQDPIIAVTGTPNTLPHNYLNSEN